MSATRVCLYSALLVLCFHVASGKPFFFSNAFWCDILCEDDDPTTTTVSSEDDWLCGDCTPRAPRTTTPAPASMAQPLSVNIPNSNSMMLNLTPNGWQISYLPGAGGAPAAGAPAAAPAAPAAAPAAPTAAPAAPPAGATTAAPGATTAAAGATTAAATTAAPAG